MLTTAGPGTDILLHLAIFLELRSQDPHRPSWLTMDLGGGVETILNSRHEASISPSR
jgi:hypothetical protein